MEGLQSVMGLIPSPSCHFFLTYTPNISSGVPTFWTTSQHYNAVLFCTPFLLKLTTAYTAIIQYTKKVSKHSMWTCIFLTIFSYSKLLSVRYMKDKNKTNFSQEVDIINRHKQCSLSLCTPCTIIMDYYECGYVSPTSILKLREKGRKQID